MEEQKNTYNLSLSKGLAPLLETISDILGEEGIEGTFHAAFDKGGKIFSFVEGSGWTLSRESRGGDTVESSTEKRVIKYGTGKKEEGQ